MTSEHRRSYSKRYKQHKPTRAEKMWRTDTKSCWGWEAAAFSTCWISHSPWLAQLWKPALSHHYNHCRKLAISYKIKYIYINTSSNPWIPFIDMHSPNTHTKEMEAHVHQKACIGVSTAMLPGTAKTGGKQSPHRRMDQRSVRLMYWLPVIWQCGWISKTKLKSQTSDRTVFITLFNEIKSRQN